MAAAMMIFRFIGSMISILWPSLRFWKAFQARYAVGRYKDTTTTKKRFCAFSRPYLAYMMTRKEKRFNKVVRYRVFLFTIRRLDVTKGVARVICPP